MSQDEITVGDLIEHLKTLDPSLKVARSCGGDAAGYRFLQLGNFKVAPLYMNARRRSYGSPHELCSDIDSSYDYFNKRITSEDKLTRGQARHFFKELKEIVETCEKQTVLTID